MQKNLMLLLSFLLVAFGQPVWGWWIGLLAACFGFALFWNFLLDIPERSKRFWISTAWFSLVQVVQLSWMASHPFAYIYGVIAMCAILMGFQFGLIGIFIQRPFFTRIYPLLALAGLWVIFEWSRLFFLSGFSFNQVGIALTGSIVPLQFASIGGVFFLSFWVMLTNLVVLRLWVLGTSVKRVLVVLILIITPYLFGLIHIYYHEKQQSEENITVLLIQPASPVEAGESLSTPREVASMHLGKWSQMLSFLTPHVGKNVDLIAFPEYVAYFGPYYPVYPLEYVQSIFLTHFGDSAQVAMPELIEPYATRVQTDRGEKWYATNSYFSQTLANFFQADVVIGLEDHLWDEGKKRESYSSAMHYSPDGRMPERYEKRVLVPMGEYIPFSFCREWAAQYGVFGSFTCGTEARVCHGKVSFSPSICYEETFGNLIQEGRVKGAQLLVNLTNDGWFPHSTLPQQHFDHARLRSVENGIPMVRACNTGITAAVDSRGNVIAVLGDNPIDSQEKAGALYATVPLYHYRTPYSIFGDSLIVAASFAFLLLGLFLRRR